MINISVKATNIELTPAMRSYAEEKIGMLEKLIDERDGDVRADVELERITAHQSGEIFRAEVNFHTSHMSLRAESTQEDMYAAIDLVKDDVMRELRRTKNKNETMVRRGGRMFKQLVQKMGWGE